MPKINTIKDLKYISFNNLSELEFIHHGFSTRLGGVSTGHYESMNLGFNRGDSKENVMTNFKKICQALDIDIKNLVLSNQTHTTNIRKVGKANIGEGIFKQTEIKNYDGMVTDETDVFMVTYYADCVPLFFADKINKVVALSHAGWKGTLEDMAGTTVRLMQEKYNTNPKDIYVGIGPAIGKCCFEVHCDVGDLFLNPEFENESLITSKIVNGTKKYNINLPEINKRKLILAGVLKENIETADICTSCNSDWLFSHRASKGKRGSMCAIMGITKDV